MFAHIFINKSMLIESGLESFGTSLPFAQDRTLLSPYGTSVHQPFYVKINQTQAFSALRTGESKALQSSGTAKKDVY